MDIRRFNLPRYLALLPAFQGLPAERLESLGAAARLRRLARGDLVFRAGDECSAYHIVVTGQAKLFVLSPSGQEKVVELAGPACSLGEEALFAERPYTLSAQALGDALVMALDAAVLLDEIDRDPRLARRMLAGAGRRMQGLVEDIESQALKSGVARIVAYLVKDASNDDDAGDGEATIELPASKATIASRLSLTPEYFSRVLHELQAAGLIRVDRQAIRIHDRQRLAGYAVAA